jgi:hypothetical protein
MQNTSTAVMQRRTEPHDSLDFFPTPPWATRALCEHVLADCELNVRECWEPACGEGHMARPLKEYFHTVRASDIFDYGYGIQEDFLFGNMHEATEWVITNPPFRLADQFARQALELSACGVALLVRSAFLEGKNRFENLFSVTPPSIIAQFVERLPMVKGRVDEDASSATAYSWLVWLKRDTKRPRPTEFVWIPPCRKRLERQGDYA